ncbi:MAG: methyltransferase, partial [Pseudomonadales bacterium]|nr:methyltransferase [Pseudomonadales bacterium]
MSDTLFKTEFGQFDLRPSNFHPKSPLRAWNAADELLLNHLKQHCPVEFPRILVVNDACGALAVSLHHYEPESWGDYYTGTQSLQLNLQRNQIESDRVDVLSSIDSLSGTYDVVLLQLPKTLSLLAFQLAHLRQHVRSDTLIVAGGMVKHMTPSMSELFEQYIGPVQASLAEKKARLLFCQLDETLEPAFPEATVYGIPDSPLQLVSHANVFSQQKLDIGTRFLLEHFPDTAKASRIVDLGCGNGALGLFAGWRNPAAELYFIDDS